METAPSPPSRRISLTEQISSLGHKVTRALSRDSADTRDGSATGVVPDLSMDWAPSYPIRQDNESKPRSVSRGREMMQSSGRGGAGNIRPSSVSRGRSDVRDGPDDFSSTRGREPLAEHTHTYSTGRGGAGNVRSPSRDPVKTPPTIPEDEQELIRLRNKADAEGIHSSGRGGLGNINRSRSRSRDIAAQVHSTGRGGLGNIKPGEGLESGVAEETEWKEHAHEDEGPHSTGRGGTGNITSLHDPQIETLPSHADGPLSTGRGGAGNIHAPVSANVEPPHVHSTGRGGYGNIQPKLHIRDGIPHGTGRGGAGNITSVHEPDIDRPSHRAEGYESTGRGGAGNIRDRSRSRDPRE